MVSKSASVWRRAGLAWVLAVLGFCPAAFASSSVYVANEGSNTVSQFTVAADGTLSPKSRATIATGTSPREIVLSAAGKSAYVTNSKDNTVSQYTVGSDGLGPTPGPPTVATGSFPSGVAVWPSPPTIASLAP
jgi:DNA-binding beta-propeller fold protein YncE